MRAITFDISAAYFPTLLNKPFAQFVTKASTDGDGGVYHEKLTLIIS